MYYCITSWSCHRERKSTWELCCASLTFGIVSKWKEGVDFSCRIEAQMGLLDDMVFFGLCSFGHNWVCGNRQENEALSRRLLVSTAELKLS